MKQIVMIGKRTPMTSVWKITCLRTHQKYWMFEGGFVQHFFTILRTKALKKSLLGKSHTVKEGVNL